MTHCPFQKIRDENPWVTVEPNGAVRVKKKWDFEELGREKTIDFWVIITNSGSGGRPVVGRRLLYRNLEKKFHFGRKWPWILFDRWTFVTGRWVERFWKQFSFLFLLDEYLVPLLGTNVVQYLSKLKMCHIFLLTVSISCRIIYRNCVRYGTNTISWTLTHLDKFGDFPIIFLRIPCPLIEF